MIGVLINAVSMFLTSIPSEITHAIQIKKSFLLMPPTQLSFPSSQSIISYFIVRKTIQEEYEDDSILKIELMVVAPLWAHHALSLVDKNIVCSTPGDGY